MLSNVSMKIFVNVHISYYLILENKFDKHTNDLAFFVILKIAMTFKTAYLKFHINDVSFKTSILILKGPCTATKCKY